MINDTVLRYLVGAVLLAFSVGTAQAAMPAFIQLLEVLRNNGTINQEAYEMLRRAALEQPAKSSADAAGADDKTSPDTKSEPRKHAKTAAKPKDKKRKIRADGRLHVDLANYQEENTELGNGGEVRRARIGAKGTLWNEWDFRASVEFAGNEVDLKSTYIRYTGLDRKEITFGNFKEPFSLEELSSSNYSTFMERAMATEFVPGRNIGLGFNTYREKWAFNVGGFREGGTSEGEADEGWGVTGRLTVAPMLSKNRILHLGGAVSHRELGDEDTARFRTRPESHVTDVRLVDTGDIVDVNDIVRLGAEASLVLGPWSLQSEYIATELDRKGDLPTLNFSGWYAYASWFLTGESRSYDAVKGTFGKINPKGIVGMGGYGAWELAARFSTIDLTDGDVVGGKEDNFTLGLNWYATPNIRFMLNYVDVLSIDRPGSSSDGDEPEIIQFRGQVNL